MAMRHTQVQGAGRDAYIEKHTCSAIAGQQGASIPAGDLGIMLSTASKNEVLRLSFWGCGEFATANGLVFVRLGAAGDSRYKATQIPSSDLGSYALPLYAPPHYTFVSEELPSPPPPPPAPRRSPIHTHTLVSPHAP